MGSNLLKIVPAYVLNIMNTLEQNNYKAYLVGGVVRDLLLDKCPEDYDVATSAFPRQIKSIFPRVVATGEKHGTVTVVTNDGNVEVTTMRRDGVYKDNRRPETVEFADNIVEDLSRRDFTINAMAVDINGNLIDPFGGRVCLRDKLIKTVGDANERFNEDALRMMRAVRFVCQLDFGVDFRVVLSIIENKELIKNISAERIRDELCKILVSDKPGYGIDLLGVAGILSVILPEVEFMVGFDQFNSYHCKDVFEHTLDVVNAVPNNLITRLTALLHDIGKPKTFSIDENGVGHFYKHHIVGADMARNILQRLKFDNKTIDAVCVLVKEHMSRYSDNKSVKKLINRVGIKNIDSLFDLQIADIKASFSPDIEDILKAREIAHKIINEEQPLTVKDLKINGFDLMALGIFPGKKMGELLQEMLEMVLENPKLNDRDFLIKYIKSKGGI